MQYDANDPVSDINEPHDGNTTEARQLKDRATALKATFADKLQAGANRLREHASQMPEAETTNRPEGKMRKAEGQIADRMESTANWVRNADMASLKSGIEEQVRSKPGRTLLIALGVGYILGRALSGKREA